MLFSDARYETLDGRRVRIPDTPREERDKNDTPCGPPDSWSQLLRAHYPRTQGPVNSPSSRRHRVHLGRRSDRGRVPALLAGQHVPVHRPRPVRTSHVNQVTRDEAGGPADQVASQIAAEEAARIKRRQVIAGNKQWRAATTHRQKSLRELAARKIPPARMLTTVLAAVGGCDWDLINALQKGNDLASERLGIKVGLRPGQDPRDDHLVVAVTG